MLAVEVARSDRLLHSCIRLWGHRDRNAIWSEVQGGGVDRPEADEHWKALPCDFGLVRRCSIVTSSVISFCVTRSSERPNKSGLTGRRNHSRFRAAEHKYCEAWERKKLPDAGRGFNYLSSMFEDVPLSLGEMASLKIGTDGFEIHPPAHYQASWIDPPAFGCA